MTTCCGLLWSNLGRHLRFAHGEEVVIPEQHEHEWYYFDLDHKPFPGICMLCGTLAADERIDTRPVGERVSGLGASFSAMTPQVGAVPCFCGAPAVRWTGFIRDLWRAGVAFHRRLQPAMTHRSRSLRCFCGAPAVGWVYQVMGDGQTINGLAVCAAHQEEQL